MLFSIIVSVVRSLLEKDFLLILKGLKFVIQSICSMSAYVCKVCNLSSDENSDLIFCKGKCKQYLHQHCADIAEKQFRKKQKKATWKCKDCRAQKEFNTSRTEDKDFEIEEENSLSPNNGQVGDHLSNQNGCLHNHETELNALKQELTETKKSLEQLRTEYNKMSNKVVNIEQLIKTQERNLNKVSENVCYTHKTVCALGQNVRDNQVEIHGLLTGTFLIDDIKRKIVNVGKCFGVHFSVNDIDKVDKVIKKDPQRPILVVHFVSKEVRDHLIAARKKKVTNDCLPECSDRGRIYINESLSSYFKSLFYQTRELAKRKGFQFFWIREGKLYVKKDYSSQKKRITCKEDLEKLEADKQ